MKDEDSSNILYDEGDDVKQIHNDSDSLTSTMVEAYHEDELISQLPEDVIEVNLDGISNKVQLYGNKFGDQFLFEGDVLMDYPDTNVFGLSVGITTMNRKWRKTNNRLVIPYEIDLNLSDQEKEKVQTAINMWTSSTGIQFKLKNGPDTDYVVFRKALEGCFVYQIGRSGGKQSINISSQCGVGNIAHEIGHILGLFHEQSRADRDQYIIIDMNQAGGKASQYKHATDIDAKGKPIDIGNYDFYSIMHYPERPYFQVRQQFKESLTPGIPGQRNSLSQGDVAAIKSIYTLP